MMNEASSSPPLHTLRDDEVHVWSIVTALPPPAGDRVYDCLAPAEAARAARLLNDAARARFITTRVALRHILARYVGGSADLLELRTEPRGKPVVHAAPRIHFSLSHARDLALVAVGRSPLGIDVEHVRVPRHLERTAQRILHPDTCRALLALPPHRRAHAFLHAWTQREAHVKALGGGLYRTPDTLPFIGEPADERIHRVHDRVDHSLWSVARFSPRPHATAAITLPGDLNTLRFFDWDPATWRPNDE